MGEEEGGGGGYADVMSIIKYTFFLSTLLIKRCENKIIL